MSSVSTVDQRDTSSGIKPTGESSSGWTANAWRPARVLAMVLLLAGLAWLGAAGLPSVCQQQGFVANDGADQQRVLVQTLCRPAVITDPVFVAVGLALLMLIMPEMAEVGGFGITLKRRVAAAEAKQATTENELRSLSMRIASTASSGSQSIVYIGDVRTLPERVEEKEAAWREGNVAAFVSPRVLEVAEAPTPPERALERIMAVDEVAALGRTRVALPTSEKERFDVLFGDEMEEIQAVRNAVVHGREVSTEDLNATVDAARRLQVIATSPPSA